MAFWNIKTEDGQVRLAYVARIGGDEQPCGQGPMVLKNDLEAWVCDQAQPFDIISTPVGMFVRQNPVQRGRRVGA